MKLDRHNKILELLGEREIETQDELVRCLNEAGFPVTQATVSRDIRELNLTKTMNEEGHSVYTAASGGTNPLLEKYSHVLRDAVVSMDTAQNILVIKTVPGMAMGVGAALDELKFPEIVGSIAGDDTVMCVFKKAEEAVSVMSNLNQMIQDIR